MNTHYLDYGYAGCEHWDPKFARYLVAMVSGLPGVQSVCELGCGNGALADLLSGAGFRVVGVDASASGIEQAKRRGGCGVFRCDMIDGQIGTRLREMGGFDLVLSSEVIEHLYRPTELIAAALSLLRPGGWLVLTTPYHGYWKYLALAVSGHMDRHLNPNWDGGHIKFFSVDTLRNLIQRQGMTVERFAFHGRVPGLWKRMICISSKAGEGHR